MRKIEQQMVNAFRAANRAFHDGKAKSWKSGNTEVRVGSASVAVYLHGHAIFRVVYPQAPIVARYRMEFSLAGWNTATTRSRVNALLREYAPGHRVYQERGEARLHHAYDGGSYDQVINAWELQAWHTVRKEP